jgi:hypothetical protein
MVFAASHDRRVTEEMRAPRMRGQPILEGGGQEPGVEAVDHSLAGQAVLEGDHLAFRTQYRRWELNPHPLARTGF